MRLRVLLAAVAAALVVYPAAAQEPDNATILKAIQGLAGRVDGLQKDVDKLKGKPAASPKQESAGQPAPASRAATAAKLKGRSIPGWVLDVVPGEDETKDSIVTFGGPLSTFNFGLHAKATDSRSELAYHGMAFFHPEQAGRYVFVVSLYPIRTCCNYNNYGFDCSANLKIADNVIVSGITNFGFQYGEQYPDSHELSHVQTFSGGADLEPVDYKMTFAVNCYLDERHKGETLNSLFKPYQDNKFTILVKGPDDEKARPFEPNELFHVVKPKKS